MKFIFIKIFFLMLFILVCSTSGANNTAEALNYDTSSSERNSLYPVSFFKQYTPQNAMNMISRLPGFTFDGGTDERGFGGNAGNVLINGTRPSSKSGGLKDALQRIPASQVLHIEILRGGVSAGEAAGQSVVANIVKKETATSGIWGIKTVRDPNGTFKPQIEGSLAIELNTWDTSFDAELGAEPKYKESLIEALDDNYEQVSSSDEITESIKEYIALNGEGSRVFTAGKLNINGAFSTYKTAKNSKRETLFTPYTVHTSSDEYWQLEEHKEVTEIQLGIDWITVNDDWKLRLIALTSTNEVLYKNYELTEYKSFVGNQSSQYAKDTLETEHIARITYGKTGGSLFKPELGIEIANNRLSTDLELIENGELQALEGADAVEELRGEIFVNFVYNHSPITTLEGSITTEFSTIEAFGEGDQSQNFSFIKPRISANFSINDSSSITLIAEHMVEQLDFNDFSASSNVSENRTTSGNSSLKPEKVTAFSVIYDWRFSERGSLNIEGVFEQRKDVHEQIFLPSGNEGIGNAGAADFWYVKTNVSLPIDLFLENGLLEVYHSYKNSDFFDPIIQSNRTIYNYIPHYIEINLRQDVVKYNFSWGMEYKQYTGKTRYYVDEIQKNESNKRLSYIFIETTNFFNMKTRFEIKDVNVARFRRSRENFEEDRGGEFHSSEITYKKREPEISLSFTGTY